MRWRKLTTLGSMAAIAVAAWALWSWAVRTRHGTDRSSQFLSPASPALTSSVRARAAGVPLPTVLLEAQHVGLSPPTGAAVPVIPGPALPERCTQAWKPDIAPTRCGHGTRTSAHTNITPWLLFTQCLNWDPQAWERRKVLVIVTRTRRRIVRCCWRSTQAVIERCDDDLPEHWHEHLAGGEPCAWHTVPTRQRCADGFFTDSVES